MERERMGKAETVIECYCGCKEEESESSEASPYNIWECVCVCVCVSDGGQQKKRNRGETPSFLRSIQPYGSRTILEFKRLKHV